MSDNRLLPFQLESTGFRGRIVRLDTVLNNILAPHDYPPVLAELTGQAALLGVLLSSLLKYEGIFTLQAQGDGPLAMLVADMTSTGDVRACATMREGDTLPDRYQTLDQLFGEGYLAFTVDQGEHTERYQGIVEMKPEGLAASIQHYFLQSEQIRTGLVIYIKRTEGGWRGAGLILQEMPAEGGIGAPHSNEEDDWRRAMILMESCTEEELLGDIALEDMLYRLFHEEGVRIYEPQEIHDKCRCSRDRLDGILRGMPQEDLDHITKEGHITLHCEFCSKDYIFNAEDYKR